MGRGTARRVVGGLASPRSTASGRQPPPPCCARSPSPCRGGFGRMAEVQSSSSQKLCCNRQPCASSAPKDGIKRAARIKKTKALIRAANNVLSFSIQTQAATGPTNTDIANKPLRSVATMACKKCKMSKNRVTTEYYHASSTGSPALSPAASLAPAQSAAASSADGSPRR